MSKFIYIKRLKLYGWIGLSLFLFNLMSDMGRRQRPFLQNVSSDLWMAIFVIALNYLIFEFTLPQLSRKRIFRSVLILLGHSLVYLVSIGIWNHIGLASQIYIEPNLGVPADERESQLSRYAVGSVFFFGIIRHIYNYRQLRRPHRSWLIEKQQAELNYLKSQTNPHFCSTP